MLKQVVKLDLAWGPDSSLSPSLGRYLLSVAAEFLIGASRSKGENEGRRRGEEEEKEEERRKKKKRRRRRE